jgi:hypothetical protein
MPKLPKHAMSRCKQCNQPLVEIDHYGERLKGCLSCNWWQAATGEWCRLAADDIVALRALKTDSSEQDRDLTKRARGRPESSSLTAGGQVRLKAR